MMWRYLTLAGRNILRNRSYALLNVAGLALGLTLAFLIGLWVQDELRTDRFHGHGDRLVRVLHSVPTDNGVQTWRNSPFALAAAAERTVPGVERAIPTDAWSPTFAVGQGAQATREEGLLADSTFFEVFAFPLVAGDPASVLGARAEQLFLRFSTDYLKLVAIAFVVATPLAYRVTSQWLGRFAYRIDLDASIFVGAGALPLVVALLVVGYQARCVACLDPATTLRDE